MVPAIKPATTDAANLPDMTSRRRRTSLLPLSFEQWLQWMLTPLDTEIVEDLSRLERLSLRIESDAEVFRDVFTDADEHQLGAFLIQKRGRIERYESAALELPLKGLRQLRLFAFRKPDARRRRLLWILDRDDVIAFLVDVELLLNCTRFLGQLESKRQVRVAVVADESVHALARWPRGCQVPLAAYDRRIRQRIEVVLDVLSTIAYLSDETPAAIAMALDLRQFLAADDDEPVSLLTVGTQDDEEALYVLEPSRGVAPNSRTINEVNIAALENVSHSKAEDSDARGVPHGLR
jgi:hypothetical protein